MTNHWQKAKKAGSPNFIVFFRSAQIEEMFDNQADALRYIDRALELDPGNAEYSEFKKSLLQNNWLLSRELNIGGQDGRWMFRLSLT